MRIEATGTIMLEDMQRAFAIPARSLPTVSEQKPVNWKARASCLFSLLAFVGLTWVSLYTVWQSG
jgi:hypothetical protein